MASTLVGALRVTLGIDSATFMAGATQAERRAYLMGERIGKALRAPVDAAMSLKTAMVALGSTAVAGAISAAVSRALDYASSLGEVSQQLGISARDLQEYRYAATQAGISQEMMDKSLAKLTQTMGKAREGVKSAKAPFAELSAILGKDILTNALTAGDAIPLIAEAMSKIADPTRRAAIEIQLFGKAGQQLDTLLAGGAGAVNELRDAAHSLGIVLSERQIQEADQTADKLAELKTVLEANIAGAVANNANAIYQLVDSLSALIAKIPAAIRWMENFQDQAIAFEGRAHELAGMGINGFGMTNPNLIRKGRAAQEEANRRIASRRGAAAQAAVDEKMERYGLANPWQRRVTRGGAPAGEGAGGSRRSGGSRRRGGVKSAAELAEEAAEKQRRYADDLARADIDRLRATQDLTVEQTERARLERDIMAREYGIRVESINANKDLTEAQKKELIAVENATYFAQIDLAARGEREAAAAQELQIANSRIDNEQDILRASAEFARTNRERRDIELQLVNLQFRQLDLEQDRIIASEETTALEKEIARERKKTLNQLRGFAVSSVERQNAGPLAQYLDELPRSAEELNEALERVQAEGLKGLTDGLADVIAGTRSLGDVFKSVTNQIIADIARMAIQKGITSLLSSLFDKGSSGNSFGAALSSIFGGARANGGPVMAGKTYLVGERGPELFSPRGSGQIIANENLPVGRSVEIIVHADEGAMFVPRVQAISDGVTVTRMGEARDRAGRAGRRRLGR